MNLISMGDFDDINPNAINVNDITNEEIKTYIKNQLTSNDDDEAYPSFVLNAFHSIGIPMEISNVEARVIQFCNELFERLEAAGYMNFCKTNPKKTIHLLCGRLYQLRLMSEMKRQLDFNESLRSDVKTFIKPVSYTHLTLPTILLV